MSRKQNNYSLELKLEAVKMYLDGGIGSHRIAKALGLSCNKRVLDWSKKYQEYGLNGLKERRGRANKSTNIIDLTEEDKLKEANLTLRAEVEYLKKLLQIERV